MKENKTMYLLDIISKIIIINILKLIVSTKAKISKKMINDE